MGGGVVVGIAVVNVRLAATELVVEVRLAFDWLERFRLPQAQMPRAVPSFPQHALAFAFD